MNQENLRYEITTPRSQDLVVDPFIDRFDLAFLLRRYFWRLLIAPVLCVCIAVGYYKTRQPMFKSTATIMVDPSFDQLIQVEQTGRGSNTDQGSLNSLASVVAGDPVILRVVDKLDLRNSEGFLPEGLAAMKEVPDAKLVRFLKGSRISTQLIPQTRLIEISVMDPDPVRARDIANAFSSEFESYLTDQRSEEIEKARKSLQKQSDEAKKAALAAEDRLRKFRKENPTYPVEQEEQLFIARLTQFGDELNLATRERMLLESQEEALANLDERDSALDIIEIAGYSGMNHVSSLLNGLAASRARLSAQEQTVTPNHPSLHALEAEVELNEKQLAALAKEIKKAVHSKFEAAVAREDRLQEKLDELKDEIVDVKAASSTFKAMRQEAEGEWLAHQALQQQLSQQTVANDLHGNISTLVSAPLVPDKKSDPSLLLFLIVGGGIGSIISASWVLWQIFSGLPFSNPRQLEQRFGLPVIADWSGAKGINLQETSRRLIHRLEHQHVKTIQIAHPYLETGTANSVALSVAQAAAENGKRSLILTVRPGAIPSKPVPTDIPNLDRITIPPESVFNTAGFQSGMTRLEAEYDNIVIEAESTCDPELISQLSEAADQDIIVVAKGTARKETIEETICRLARREGVSIALIMIDPSSARISHLTPDAA